MIHVYAFVDGLSELPAAAGVGGAAVTVLAAAGVEAVVSRHPVAPAGDPREDAVAHGLVVESLVAASVLPVRFGEAFATDEELLGVVRGRAAAIRAGLARVRGCVEVGVRVSARGGVVSGARTGTEYLRSRLAEVSERERLDELLAPLVRDAQQAGGGEAAYLVEREHAEEALALVRSFAREHPALSVVATGPWAPYSFGGGVA